LNLSDEVRRSANYDEVFAFDRTVSRLLEMQSESYVRDCTSRNLHGAAWLKKHIFHTENVESIPAANADMRLKTLNSDEVRVLYQQYNWGRDISAAMPVPAAQTLFADVEDLVSGALPPPNAARAGLASMSSEACIDYEKFKAMLQS
jgi:hypothetical protein